MNIEHGKFLECIKKCCECRYYCQTTLFSHCLIKGEGHAAVEHVKAMIDCIEICQLAADFMMRNSRLYKFICEACASACEYCAQSCEKIDDVEMRECAKICHICAQICSRMSVN